MRADRLVGVVVLAGLVLGCQSRQSDDVVVAPPTSADKVQMTRDSFQKVDPKVRVGVVSSVLPEAALVAVVQIPVKEFKIGDTLTFIDSNQEPFANGRIVNIVGESLHVQFVPGATGRAPVKGDMAVAVVKN